MTTLVLRFAGPLQAWPTHSRGTRRPSHQAPAYSGISGLFRCAQGLPRNDRSDPLKQTRIAVRIDRPGRRVWDYHTINQLPNPDNRFSVGRELVPQVLKMDGKPYAPTVITNREYISDGAFTCFVSGDRAHLDSLAASLWSPKWATFMGRKSCAPAPDMCLGIFATELAQAVREVPVVDIDAGGSSVSEGTAQITTSREIHWLFEPDSAAERLEWPDQPDGPVGATYQARPRWVSRVSCPVVGSGSELRHWVHNNVIVQEGVHQ